MKSQVEQGYGSGTERCFCIGGTEVSLSGKLFEVVGLSNKGSKGKRSSLDVTELFPRSLGGARVTVLGPFCKGGGASKWEGETTVKPF